MSDPQIQIQSIVRSLLRNASARSLAELCSRLGSAIFWILVVRYLGQSALGSLAFGLSLFAMIFTLAKLGLGSVLIRKVAEHPNAAARIFGNGLLLGLLTSVFSAGMMLLLSQMLSVAEETRTVVRILAAAMPFSTAFYWSQSLIWSAERQDLIAVAHFLENMVKVVLGLLVLFAGKGLISLAWVILGSKILSFGLGFYFAVRIAPPDFRFNREIMRAFVSCIPTFALISLFYDVFVSVAVVLLAHLRGEAEAGLFSAGYKLLDILIFVTHAYSQALFPILARFKADRSMLLFLLHKSVKYLWMFSLAAAAGAAVLAQPIVHLVYGEELLSAVPVFRLLVIGLVPLSLIPAFAFALLSLRLERFDLLANGVACCLLISLGVLLIPSYGALGAAGAQVIAALAFLWIEFRAASRSLVSLRVQEGILFPILGTVVMSIAVYAMRDWNLFAAIAIGMAIYFGFLWATRFFADVHRFLLRAWTYRSLGETES